MTTTLDANVHNVAVEGAGADFDACQAAVKAAFGDEVGRKRAPNHEADDRRAYVTVRCSLLVSVSYMR